MCHWVAHWDVGKSGHGWHIQRFSSMIWNEILETKIYVKRFQVSDFFFLLHFTGHGWWWMAYDEYSTKQNLGKKTGGERWLLLSIQLKGPAFYQSKFCDAGHTPCMLMPLHIQGMPCSLSECWAGFTQHNRDQIFAHRELSMNAKCDVVLIWHAHEGPCCKSGMTSLNPVELNNHKWAEWGPRIIPS